MPTRHGLWKPPCSLSLQRTTKKAEVGYENQGCALEARTGKQKGRQEY